MKTRAYPLRIPKTILTVSRLRAEEEHLDISTTLRQFLHVGAEEYLLKLISNGRISIGRASELMDISIYDIYNLAQKHGIILGSTTEQALKSRNLVRKIIKVF